MSSFRRLLCQRTRWPSTSLRCVKAASPFDLCLLCCFAALLRGRQGVKVRSAMLAGDVSMCKAMFCHQGSSTSNPCLPMPSPPLPLFPLVNPTISPSHGSVVAAMYSWHHKSAYTHLHLCGLEHSCACPTDIWTSVTMSLGTAHQSMQP